MDLPQRRKLRLKGHDYNRNGMYFVTICTANRLPLFGEITDGNMHCNDNGLIVQENIDKLNHLYQGVAVNHSVVMPDHVHLMITVCRERRPDKITIIQNDTGI